MNKLRTVGRWVLPTMIAFLPVAALAITLTNPTATLSGKAVTLDEIEDLITGIAKFLIIVSIIIAVIFIVYGGIRWIAARDSEDAVKAAKDIIKNGIIGAFIVLAVGIILNTLAGVVSRSFFGAFQ